MEEEPTTRPGVEKLSDGLLEEREQRFPIFVCGGGVWGWRGAGCEVG